MLLSLSLLAAATVLSTSVLVEDLAVGDEASMSMAALLVSLLSPSTPVVAFEALQTMSVVPLEEVAPLPVSLLTVGLAVLHPMALEGAASLTVLFSLIALLSMVRLQDIDKGEVFSMLTILVLLSSWCTNNAVSAHLCAEAKHDTHVS